MYESAHVLWVGAVCAQTSLVPECMLCAMDMGCLFFGPQNKDPYRPDRSLRKTCAVPRQDSRVH